MVVKYFLSSFRLFSLLVEPKQNWPRLPEGRVWSFTSPFPSPRIFSRHTFSFRLSSLDFVFLDRKERNWESFGQGLASGGRARMHEELAWFGDGGHAKYDLHVW